MVDPLVPYLIHAARNAGKAHAWEHLDGILTELAEVTGCTDHGHIRPGSPLNPFRLEPTRVNFLREHALYRDPARRN